MENMQPEIQVNDVHVLNINSLAYSSLAETRKWTLFFAILGIIGIALLLIMAVVMMIVLPAINAGMHTPVPLGMIGVVYLIFSAIYIMPVIYLLQFSSRIKSALVTRNSETLGLALKSLMLHFRTIGIITIVIISLYLIVLVGVMVMGAGIMGLSFMA
jgi:tetrahydromethanopterin S-methyltransferase subunit F